MSKWSGILGSALKGAAEVAVPYALERTADERRARIEQMRLQALFGHERAMAADQRAFQTQESEAQRLFQSREGEKDRGFQASEGELNRNAQAGIIGRQMGQQDRHHQDDVALEKRRLDIMEKEAERVGTSGGRPTDMQYMMTFMQLPKEQGGLGLSPEQAMERWEQMKRSKDDFVENYVLMMLKAQTDPMAGFRDKKSVKDLVKEGQEAYRMMKDQPSPTTPAPTGGNSDPLGIRSFLQ